MKIHLTGGSRTIATVALGTSRDRVAGDDANDELLVRVWWRPLGFGQQASLCPNRSARTSQGSWKLPRQIPMFDDREAFCAAEYAPWL